MGVTFFMAVDLSPLTTVPQQLRANNATFNAGQQADTNAFLGKYTGAINAQPTMSVLADRFGQEAGLPTLRANAQSLQNTMFQLPETYKAATRGYDVNNNQLSRIVGQKQFELGPSAELAQQNLGNAENVVNTRLGYATAEQQKQLLPYQSEQTLLTDRLARESSMFSQANQQELDGIIAKINAGVTLSEGEANRANQLAIAEKGYANALAVAKQNQAYIPIPGYGVYASQANNGNGALLGGLSGTGSLITYK